MRRLNFNKIAFIASRSAEAIITRWLPGGRRSGAEYVCRNPRRADRHLGSFKVNLRTGRWSDFATNDRGSDLISLAAYLFNLSQADAALRVAEMLGIDPYYE